MKKILLPLAALALGAVPAMAGANVYASGLKVEDGKIHFVLNDKADKVVLNIIKDGKVVNTTDLGSGEKGLNVVDMPAITITESSAYNWSLTVSAAPVTEITALTDGSDTNLQVSSGRGIAVDNHQQSPAFGSIYTVTPSSHAQAGARVQTGVYAFNAALEPINTNAYTGGITWATSVSTPNNIAVSDNGDIFVCSWGDNSNAGIYWTSPENLAGDWSDVFAEGTKNGAGLLTINGTKIHGSIQDMAFYGVGENRIMYTLDEDINDNVGDVFVYDIGNLSAPWDKAPTYDWGHPAKLTNTNQRIYSDQRGGVWLSQYRWGESTTYPCVFHLNSEGVVDYESASQDIFTGSGPLGAMGVNADGSLICVAAGDNNKTFTVASISWDENGIPSLTKLYTEAWTQYGNRPFDIAFDAVDNVYILFNNANATGGIAAWALPKEKNEYTTLSNDLITLDAMTPKAKANVYASALKVEDGKISFILNDIADNVTLNIIKDGTTIFSADLGSGEKGLNVVDMPVINISKAGNYNWSLTTTATPVTEITLLTDGSNENIQVSSGRGIAVDNHQQSPAFGNIYALTPTLHNHAGARIETGIYAYNAALEPINETAYTGGISWKANSSSCPNNLAVADNGDIFVCSWDDSPQAGVYWCAPDAIAGDWTDVFAAGSKNAAGLLTIDGVAIHGSVQDIALYGEGEKRVMYTSDEDINGSKPEDVLVYNIGTLAKPWDTAPSEDWGHPYWTNANHRLASDLRGGLWVSQYREVESETYPSIIHLNSKGDYDYHTGDGSIFRGCAPTGAMAVNADGTLLAMADSGNGATFTVASISWDEEGIPSLTKLYSHSLDPYGNRPWNIAFDAADNIYIMFNNDGATGGIASWSLPKENNEYTTNALSLISVIPTGVESQICETAISYISGIIRAEQEAEVYNINGICVARGTEIDATALAHGVYIVRAGAQTLRIIR